MARVIQLRSIHILVGTCGSSEYVIPKADVGDHTGVRLQLDRILALLRLCEPLSGWIPGLLFVNRVWKMNLRHFSDLLEKDIA